MRNFWLIAKHTYRNTVVRRGFLFGTLLVPLGFAALIGLAILVESLDEDHQTLGYVDNAGVLSAASQGDLSGEGDVIRAFPDQEAALAALERGEVQAVFILPPTYPQMLQTELYYLQEPPGHDAWGRFNDLVRVNLVSTLPDEVQDRVLDGPRPTVHDIVSGREFSQHSVVNIILPFVASVFFFIVTMSASGYMLQVVADEKENRTVEIIVTSVTPFQLIGGKAAGLLGAALTQLGIYAVTVVIGLELAAPHVPELRAAIVPWEYLGIMALFFLPAFAFIAAVMVAIGGAVTEIQQGQQVAGLLNLFFLLPLFLLGILFENPNHPVMVLMTLFPTTAFLTISLRWGLGTIPLWQLVASWVILVATALFMVWLAARIFRAGMLRYGQPLNLKSVMTTLRG